MRKIALLAFLLLPGLAAAQVSASAQVRIDLPVVLPALVVVSPGIQVVPEIENEVFYTNGYYWCRHGGSWVRSKSHRGGWVVVAPASVPPGLAKMPPGKYKMWKPAKPVKHHEGDGHESHGQYNGNGNGNGNGKKKH
jgi:hypothetical protein